MSGIVINDDFTALGELLDEAEDYASNTEYAPDSRAEALQRSQDAILERVRAEIAARSDGLRRAIVWYEKLAEDAKRVAKQSAQRAQLIRGYAQGEMEAAGVKSIKSASGSLTVRGNGGLEPLEVREGEIPLEWLRMTVSMPVGLWQDLREKFAGIQDLQTFPGVTFGPVTPDTARIREALARPCETCKGIGAPWNNSASVPCEVCAGSGKFAIPGARLMPRGRSLLVK